MQSESKCFRNLRHSNNSESELGEGLVSLVMREGNCDQSSESKGKGTRHETGTLGRDWITQHIPGHGKEFGFGSKLKRKPLKTQRVIFKVCCIEGSRVKMGRPVRRFLKDLRKDGSG